MNFDQQVKMADLRLNIAVTAGSSSHAIEAMSEADLKKENNEYINSFISSLIPGRWIAFRPKKELPYDSNVTVTLKSGAVRSPIRHSIASFPHSTITEIHRRSSPDSLRPQRLVYNLRSFPIEIRRLF